VGCGRFASVDDTGAPARVRGDTAYCFWIGTHNDFDKIIGRVISGG
jgi:hypothetical protein